MNIKIKNDEYLKEVKICSYNNFEDNYNSKFPSIATF